MVIRMRHTRSHTRHRRSHHALKSRGFSKCAQCSAAILPHRACAKCGYYRGRQVGKVKAVKKAKSKK